MGTHADITILVPGPLHDDALRRIGEIVNLRRVERATFDDLSPELAREVRGIAVMIGVDAAFMDALPHLEIIAAFGVGYEAIDVRHAGARGLIVTNTPDAATEEVADTAIGLLLNIVRELPQAEAWLRDGRWIEHGPYPLTVTSLRGRRAASSAWVASDRRLRAGCKGSAYRSPITTGIRSRLRLPCGTRR